MAKARVGNKTLTSCMQRARGARRIAWLAVWPFVVAGPSMAADGHAEKIAPGCHVRLERDGVVHVFADLGEPAGSSVTRESSSLRGGYRQRNQADADAILSPLPADSCSLLYAYDFSRVLAIEVRTAEALAALAASPSVRRVYPDGEGRATLVESRPQIRVPEAVAEFGVTGRDVVVAVLDTGIATEHPDFAGAIVHEQTFLRGERSGEAEDDNGHGTNVSGIIGSRGAVSEPGIAPDVEFVVVKVVRRDFVGFTADFAIGIEHVIELHEEDNGIEVDAICISFATFDTSSDYCPDLFPAFANACDAAAERGIHIFAAAGNAGASNAMSAPACYESVTSVGSVDGEDALSWFTNRSKRLDLLAPGEDVESSGLNAGVSEHSGTSQACPHAVGLACLLLEARPDLPSDAALAYLRETGVSVFDVDSRRTFPRIDAFAALDALTEARDCDGNGQADLLDLAFGEHTDCDHNDVPDVCDIATGAAADIDGDGVIDSCGSPFHRGDPNIDGFVDLSDALYIIGFLFLNSPATPCRESANANADDAVDLSDAVFLLNFLFTGGRVLEFPGPPGVGPCGFDTDAPDSPSNLGCASYSICQ